MAARTKRSGIWALLLAAVSASLALVASAMGSESVFLPLVAGPVPAPQAEFRGLWVTRFDWMTFAAADPAAIDALADNAAAAGFNVLLFQVRGEADAYYTPGLEPWARRLTGTLGKDPGWDPLARLVQRAHQQGLEVHAYLNAYPVWAGCEAPPAGTNPRHLYYQLLQAHGSTEGKPNGLQWDSAGNVSCSAYLRATPASIIADDHLVAVAKDLVGRYGIDGLHLDHIRYAGPATSCDPISQERYGAPCFTAGDYAGWQRQQVNGTVRRLYEQVLPLKPGLWLTATAWPVYVDSWGWGASSGRDDYYQDSKAWLAGGYVDAIMPMIYTGSPDCSSAYFWSRERWQTLVEDYQHSRNGRFIIPGIGARYCTGDDFAEIRQRIETGRALGTAGHAIYSYGALLEKGYFDDLASGPYAQRATVPEVPWHS